jgi:hypothetical protein
LCCVKIERALFELKNGLQLTGSLHWEDFRSPHIQERFDTATKLNRRELRHGTIPIRLCSKLPILYNIVSSFRCESTDNEDYLLETQAPDITPIQTAAMVERRVNRERFWPSTQTSSRLWQSLLHPLAIRHLTCVRCSY